jgi:hypothetical protein
MIYSKIQLKFNQNGVDKRAKGAHLKRSNLFTGFRRNLHFYSRQICAFEYLGMCDGDLLLILLRRWFF